MTPGVMNFIQRCAQDTSMRGNVLEVGSLNVNGSPRSIFGDRSRFPSYVGVDMREGKDVDRVANANALPFVDTSFDVVICAEMIEHDARFWVSMQEMSRVLRSGGHLILTTCGLNFPRHEYPSDYFRFTVDALKVLADFARLETLKTEEEAVTAKSVRRYFPQATSVFLLARKP